MQVLHSHRFNQQQLANDEYAITKNCMISMKLLNEKVAPFPKVFQMMLKNFICVHTCENKLSIFKTKYVFLLSKSAKKYAATFKIHLCVYVECKSQSEPEKMTVVW